ncbi:hypothetical protein ACFSCW_11795 [Sphingomonas tabacisoli]|uniref:Uncharacterized protein n=1 Tax=Sphingomonas tabacisoli TaxID=2249466 RepID=A0ABW4I6P1_9SPHN
MLRNLVFLVGSAALLAGCAGEREQVFASRRLPAAIEAKVIADAAAQVQRCYRSPRVTSDGRRITTRIAVRYAPDGSVVGLPMVLSQSGVTAENQMYADDMAEAAIASVVRCSPLHLPPELYELGWNSFELTFSPAMRG